MDLLEHVTIIRVDGASTRRQEDVVINEHALKLYVNGTLYSQLLCSPQDLRELAVGHLYTEGMLCSIDEIADISHEREDTIELTLHDKGDATSGSTRILPKGIRTVTTGCGAQKSAAYEVLDGAARRPLPLTERFELSELMDQARAFQTKSELFQKTGGVHACALCTSRDELFFREDIGRHNAFDKVIGAALLQNVSLTGKLLLTSGRVPSDMVIKAVHAKLPIIVSRSAPTHKAIEMARAYQITLCGFARGDRMNIYSVPERFVGLTLSE